MMLDHGRVEGVGGDGGTREPKGWSAEIQPEAQKNLDEE